MPEWLVVIAWVVIGCLVVATVALTKQVYDARRELDSAQSALVRAGMARAEAVLVSGWRDPLAQAVNRAARWTRWGHMTISRAPFAILTAIPSTRERAMQIQETHDSIAERVYDAIESVTEDGGTGSI